MPENAISQNLDLHHLNAKETDISELQFFSYLAQQNYISFISDMESFPWWGIIFQASLRGLDYESRRMMYDYIWEYKWRLPFRFFR